MGRLNAAVVVSAAEVEQLRAIARSRTCSTRWRGARYFYDRFSA